ncbi:MAG: hypothetical protein ABI768_12465 [Acidobacteriota bacterium]
MPFTNFPLVPAPLAVLAFLGAAGLTVTLLAGAGVAALAHRSPLARKLFAVGIAVFTFYGILLGVLGAATRERTVPPGGEKFFCEIDCHIGYSVTGVRDAAEAGVRRVVVTARARFDETTISARRGNAPLTPNPRAAALVDSGGRRFPVDAAGLAALNAPLTPGSSNTADLVFGVPADAENLRLSLVESEGPVRVLLGHERAPFAGETLLALK